MTAKFQFTEQAVRQIRIMRKQGSTMRQIAKAIGCSKTTLLEGGFNLGSLRRKFTQNEQKRMVAMRKQGRILQEIAAALRCSETSVRRRVANAGPIPLLAARPYKTRKPIPKDKRMRVMALRHRGHTLEKIAQMLNLAYATVQSIVITGGKPPARNPYYNLEKTPEDKIARIISLRRSGGSYAYIAQCTGVSKDTVARILRKNGFSGRIQLLRLAGPCGSRVRGLCRVPRCGVRHCGSGLCANHQHEYRQGRIDKNGKLLPLTCEQCGGKFPRNRYRRYCDVCRRVRAKLQKKRDRLLSLGYIDREGWILPFTCKLCGAKFRRSRKTRYCESCAAARPNILRRQRRTAIRQ